MRDDTVFLRHILDAIERIETYTAGHEEADFLLRPLVQDGTIRQLEIIGEAVKQLSPALREQYSKIPWRDIGRMRDKLIHHYFGVDLETVWMTAKQDLKPLKETVHRILASLEDSQDE